MKLMKKPMTKSSSQKTVNKKTKRSKNNCKTLKKESDSKK